MSTQASEHYTGQRGADYAAKRHSSHQSIGYDLNFAIFRPYVSPADRVLDFGCGNGGMLPRIRDHGAEPEGLEVNPAAAAVGREAGFTVYSALDEIPADRQYDVISATTSSSTSVIPVPRSSRSAVTCAPAAGWC